MATRESSHLDSPEPPLVRENVSKSKVGIDVKNSASNPDITLRPVMDDASKAASSYSASDITKLLEVLFECETITTPLSIDVLILRVKMLKDSIRTLSESESDAKRQAEDLKIEADELREEIQEWSDEDNKLREEIQEWSDEVKKLREEIKSLSDEPTKLAIRIAELEHFLSLKTYIMGFYSKAANCYWEQQLTERFEVMTYKEKLKEYQDLQKGSFRNNLGKFFVKTLESMETLGVPSNTFSYMREFVQKMGDLGITSVVDSSVPAHFQMVDQDVVVDEREIDVEGVDEREVDVEGMGVADNGKIPIEPPEAESPGSELATVGTADWIAKGFRRRSTRTSTKKMDTVKGSLPDFKKSLEVAGKGKLKKRGRKAKKSPKKKMNLAAPPVAGSSKLPASEIVLDISPQFVEDVVDDEINLKGPDHLTGGVGKSKGGSNSSSKRILPGFKNKKVHDPDWVEPAVKRSKLSQNLPKDKDVDDNGKRKTKPDTKKAGIKGRVNAKSSKSPSPIHAVAVQSSCSDQGKTYDWRLIVSKTNGRWPCRECLDVPRHFSTKEHLLRHHCDKHSLHFRNSQGFCRRKDCWTRKASEADLENQEFVIFSYSWKKEDEALKEWNRSYPEIASKLTESISETMIDLKGKKMKRWKNQFRKKSGSEDFEEEYDGKDELKEEEDDEESVDED